MNSQEIRETKIGPQDEHLGDIAFFLRELTAQVAEMNERKRKQEDDKHTMRKVAGHKAERNVVRKTSMTKYFRPNSWNIESTLEMLSGFIPDLGQPELESLKIGDKSIGFLGTKDGVEVVRIR